MDPDRELRGSPQRDRGRVEKRGRHPQHGWVEHELGPAAERAGHPVPPGRHLRPANVVLRVRHFRARLRDGDDAAERTMRKARGHAARRRDHDGRGLELAALPGETRAHMRAAIRALNLGSVLVVVVLLAAACGGSIPHYDYSKEPDPRNKEL